MRVHVGISRFASVRVFTYRVMKLVTSECEVPSANTR